MKLNRRTLNIARATASLSSLPVTALAQKKVVLALPVGASDGATATPTIVRRGGVRHELASTRSRSRNQIRRSARIAQKDVIAFSPVVNRVETAEGLRRPGVLTDRPSTQGRLAYVTLWARLSKAAPVAGWSRRRRAMQARSPSSCRARWAGAGDRPQEGLEEIIKADPKFKIIRREGDHRA
jgi:simple sugar transport system substrate-binding protein